LRIRERFDEMKNIFEKEIFPIKEKMDEFKKDANFAEILKLEKYYNSQL